MKKRGRPSRVHLLSILLVGSLGILLLAIFVTLFFEGAIYRSRYEAVQQSLERMAQRGSESYGVLRAQGIAEAECLRESLALMASGAEYGDWLALMDPNGNVTAQPLDSTYAPGIFFANDGRKNSGYSIFAQNGESFFLGSTPFGTKGDTLILFCPTSYLVQDYAIIRNGVVGLSALTFAVVFLIAFVLSLQPVKILEQDNRQLSASSWHIGRKYARQYLYELAVGQRSDTQELSSLLHSYTPFKPDACFGMAFLLVDQRRKFMTLTSQDRMLYLFGICNIMGESVAEQAAMEGYPEQEEGRCLVLYQLSSNADMDRLQQSICKGQKSIREIYDISVTALLVPPGKSIYQLPSQYDILLRHNCDRLLVGPQALLVLENRAEPQESDLQDWQKPYQEQLQQLLCVLQGGQLKSADEFPQLLSSQAIGGWRYRTALALMCSGLEQSVQLLISTRKLESGFTVICRAEDFDTAGQIEAWIRNKVQTIQEAVRAAVDRRTQLYVQMVNRLVEQHCSDSNYGVQQIAEEVGLSGVYLSRLYKQQTGNSIVDKLTTCRLHHATALLETCDSPIADVAEKCGYSSVNYFYHVFKKATGITPKEYRNLPLEQRAKLFPGKDVVR